MTWRKILFQCGEGKLRQNEKMLFKSFIFANRRVIITPSDLKIMMNMTLDLNFKGGLMIALSQVLYKNKVHFKSFLYKVCKVIRSRCLSLTRPWRASLCLQEFYSMVPVAIYFPKNSYLVESFNRKLMLFDNAGLILHWASANIDKKYLNFKAVATGPKRITLQHFSGTFQTLFGGLVLSILVFVLECFWTTVKKIKTPRIQIFQNQFGESNWANIFEWINFNLKTATTIYYRQRFITSKLHTQR